MKALELTDCATVKRAATQLVKLVINKKLELLA